MNNLMTLQKQYLKGYRIAIAVGDVSIVLLFAMLAVFSVDVSDDWHNMAFLIFVPVFLVSISFVLLRAGKPDQSLKNLPQDALEAANRECMTGMRCGNGILCESGCLLLVGDETNTIVKVRAVLCRDIERLSREQFLRMDRIAVVDVRGKVYSVVSGNRKVPGNGTFQEVEMDVFWARLNGAKERFAPSDPKKGSAAQNN